MRNSPATECNASSQSRKPVYCGIDVHKKWWVCTFIDDDNVQSRPVHIEASVDELLKVAGRRHPGRRLECCYEAGFSGFGTCRALRERGMGCIVVNAADVPTNGRERSFKCDNLDSAKLARGLKAGSLIPVYVPSREEEELRSLTRRETQIRKDITATTNRLKGHFLFTGREAPRLLGRKALLELSGQAMADGRHDLTTVSCANEIEVLRKELQWVRDRTLERIAAAGRKEVLENLMAIPGVGRRVATVFLTELMDVSRFRGKRELAAYVGIAPHAYGSGSGERDCATVGRKQRQLFYLLIQASWMATMKQGEFADYFARRVAAGLTRRRAIISVARKLLFTIYAVIRDGRPYEPRGGAEERARRKARQDRPPADARPSRAVEEAVAEALARDAGLAEMLAEALDAETPPAPREVPDAATPPTSADRKVV